MTVPLCGSKHPELDIYCSKRVHEKVLQHAHIDDFDNVVRWADPPEPRVNKDEVRILINNHEASLEATLTDVQGARGVMPDVVNTVVPMLKSQLRIMKGLLDLIDDWTTDPEAWK